MNKEIYWSKDSLKKVYLDLSLFAILMVILLIIALPDGLSTSINFYAPNAPLGANFTLFDSSAHLIKVLGYFDPASYLLGAQKLLSGWLHGADAWFFACWPPGFFLLECFFMSILGVNCPIVFCLLMTAVLLWTLALWNIYLTLGQWQPRRLAALLSTSLCFTQLFRVYFLGSGIILSESISIAILIIALCLSARPATQGSVRLALAAGTCLALSAYIRAQYEIFNSIFFISVLLLFATNFLVSANLRLSLKQLSLQKILRIPLLRLLSIALCAQVLMLPYRVYNYSQFGTMSWVRLDYYWQNMWLPREVISKNHGELALLGGLDVASRINPQLANEMQNQTTKQHRYSDNFYKQAAINTFLEHPVKWLTLKSAYLPWAWFDSLYIFKNRVRQSENSFYALLFCFILGIATFRFFVFAKHFKHNDIVSLFFLAAVLSQFICSVFGHFEPRYFYLLKTLSVVAASFYLAIYFKYPKKYSRSKPSLNQPNKPSKISALKA